MDFFSIGPLEVVLILIVALILVGPTRIVEIGKTLGRIVRAVKKASYDLTAEVTKELETEEKQSSPGDKK